MVSKRKSFKVSIQEQKGFIDEDLFLLLKEDNDEIIKILDQKIKKVEDSIQDVINSDDQIKANDKLARSVIGVGAITSAYMIAVTQNFTCFDDARKFACYCGIAPFPNSSGIRQGSSKVSQIANKKIKSLLSNCIMAAKRHDPELALYYNKKIKLGKRKGIVLNALKNKIIHRVFAVIKRKTPYVKLLAYT